MDANAARRDDDASVTRGPDDALVAAEPADADPAAGMLIIRVWREGSPGDPQLRARLTGRRRLGDEERDVGITGTIDDTLSGTRAWLEQFLTD